MIVWVYTATVSACGSGRILRPAGGYPAGFLRAWNSHARGPVVSRMIAAEVIRQHSPTEREVWTFSVIRFPVVHLESYKAQTRKTTRHKWTSAKSYHRMNVNRNAVVGERLPSEPDIPDDVLAEAMKSIAESLSFEKWSGR